MHRAQCMLLSYYLELGLYFDVILCPRRLGSEDGGLSHSSIGESGGELYGSREGQVLKSRRLNVKFRRLKMKFRQRR